MGLFKTEVVRHSEPWRHLEAAEFATLDWVNHQCLPGSIGNITPAASEENLYATFRESTKAA